MWYPIQCTRLMKQNVDTELLEEWERMDCPLRKSRSGELSHMNDNAFEWQLHSASPTNIYKTTGSSRSLNMLATIIAIHASFSPAFRRELRIAVHESKIHVLNSSIIGESMSLLSIQWCFHFRTRVVFHFPTDDMMSIESSHTWTCRRYSHLFSFLHPCYKISGFGEDAMQIHMSIVHSASAIMTCRILFKVSSDEDDDYISISSKQFIACFFMNRQVLPTK